jgi:two-component system LytT family response regulator
MKPINSLIVDDEKKGRNVLRKLLAKFCPEVEVVGEASNVNEAYEICIEKKPELVFLDIQMSTGNGFKLLEKFDDVPFDVIFVTGFDQYAINAIKFSALDYLLKPVEVNELKNAVDRALKSGKASKQVQIVNLLSNIDPSVKEKKISIHYNDKVMVIGSADISYIEAEGRYSNITSRLAEKYVLSKTLKEFEEFFAENPLLVRISKSVMLNVDNIKAYAKEEPYYIEMKDGKLFEISRRKRQEVLDKLKRK